MTLTHFQPTGDQMTEQSEPKCSHCPEGCRSCEPRDCECYTHQDEPDQRGLRDDGWGRTGMCTACGAVEVDLVKAAGSRDLSAIGESASYPTGYGCEVCS